MRAIGMSFVLILMAAGAKAQQPAPAPQRDMTPHTYTSASDVTALIAKAKSERKEGQANVSEIMYVIDGSATMVTGGKLVDEKRTNPANLSGTGIEGGTSQHVSKGDFMVVPENTAHWFSAIDGTLVLMTLHVPRPVPAAH
jgi:mannose-6-phosphate isomerase-like protein (cupin superfamily)